MSEITFLASSKPLKIPEEIREYNHRMGVENEEGYIFFSVHEVAEGWLQEIQGLFSLPYIYEAEGVRNRLFLTYLEKYMETGEVL